NPFDLKMDVPNPSYTLVYTIDGSDPQTSSTAIDGGQSATITVDPADTNGRAQTPCYIVRASLKLEGMAPSFPLTQTYIFLDHVMNQTHPGGEWPTGSVNGQVIDLGMDTDITLSPQWGGLMNESMKDIPSISVVTELSDLFDSGTGIYVNAMSHGDYWERFSSVELIDPSGNPGFNINAGLRIRGGYSRHSNYPKHAFRLFFREDYGAAKLQFPLFGDEGVQEFDKIDLRCEQNYAWSHPGDDRRRNTGVREVFSRDTQRDMGWPYTRSRYYHLYLNGMYWGLFQTQERSEARYAADYFGGSKEDYDVIKVAADKGEIEATDGTLDSWQKIYNLCSKGFASNADYFALEGKDQYGYPKEGGEVMVDIDNLIDYMQLIFYTGNFDSPVSAYMDNNGANNYYTIDKRDDRSSGFLFFAHDAEHTMMIEPRWPGFGLQENRVQIPNMGMRDFTKFHPQWIHHKLTSNSEYRQRFADRAYKNFFNKGVFTPDAVRERFAKRAAEIEMAIIGESARWGDTFQATPLTKDDWTTEINDIYTRYFPFRTDIVINQLKTANLLASFNPPVFTKDNTTLDEEQYSVSGNYQVTITGTGGQIIYTLDGSDPREVGGEINRSAKEIATGANIPLQGTAIIKARVKNGAQWSALAQVKLMDTNENYAHLKVTELHYHPTDSLMGNDTIPGTDFEFIELKNTGDKPISLSGLKFTSGIEYEFKPTDILAPKHFWVIASKPKWFYERHFMVPSGNFAKNFANSGEQVVIANAAGSPVIDFWYFDINPWPVLPDGDGPSLSSVLRHPTGNPADASYWTASSVYDGSPFADDPGIVDTIDDPALAQDKVSVFPNPTRGVLYLKVGDSNTEVKVEISSLAGSVIYQSTVDGNSMIDLGRLNLGAGIYLVKTRCNQETAVHKVVYQQ
ncbi:MAG TPA: CotH kinase family protein, partial [Prolixibacteraceae bacterium]|nr:CotH kinase family protein [Prolixibacteraceae bacterium]